MKRIKILTTAPQGTLGDPSFAEKLRQQLLEQSAGEQLEITVVVLALSQYKEVVDKVFPDKAAYRFIDNAAPEAELEKILVDSDLIVVPTPHFMSMPTKNLLDRLKKPTIALVEYNFDTRYNMVKMPLCQITGGIFLSTGLGPGTMGIYIEETPLSRVGKQAIKIHPDDEQKLSDILQSQNPLYFGYFNGLIDSHTLANPATFIAMAAQISAERQIDIILPLKAVDKTKEARASNINWEQQEELLLDKKFMSDLGEFNQIGIMYKPPEPDHPRYYIYQQGTDGVQVRIVSQAEFNQAEDQFDKTIRLINPFPLHKESMLALMQLAEPFCMATGDQSMSEALSLCKILFYQAMPWKLKLYQALCAGTTVFPALNHWFNAIGTKNYSLKTLAEYYLKNQKVLVREMMEFRELLLGHSNLAKNLAYIVRFPDLNMRQKCVEFINSLKLHPDYFATVQEKQSYLLRPDDILHHISFYFKHLNHEERQEMLNYMYHELRDIFEHSLFPTRNFFSRLKRSYPELEYRFSSRFVINSLKKHLTLGYMELNVLFSRGADGAIEYREDEDQYDFATLRMPAFSYLEDCLGYLKTIRFTTEEKFELLDMMIQSKAIAYPYVNFSSVKNTSGTKELFDLIQDETSPELIRHAARFIFLTPCYKESNEMVSFNPMKPALFFQFNPSERRQFLAFFLETPEKKALMFDLLFNPEHTIKKSGLPCTINQLILEGLFFPELTSSYSYQFYSQATEKSLIWTVIDVENPADRALVCAFFNSMSQYPDKIKEVQHYFPEWLNNELVKLSPKANPG